MSSTRGSPRSSPPRDQDHLKWESKTLPSEGTYGRVYVRAGYVPIFPFTLKASFDSTES